MATARRVVVALLAAEVAVVAASGLALVFLYEPTPAQFLGDTVPDNGVQASDVLRVVHGWVSFLLVGTAVLAGVVLVVRRGAGERALPRLAWAVATLGVLVNAVLTGLALPYDQIALRTVTVGGNRTGYLSWLGEQDVNFFLVDGVEVARSTLAKLLALHAVALGGALVGLVGVAWWCWVHRAAAPAAGPSAGTPPAGTPPAEPSPPAPVGPPAGGPVSG